MFNSQYQSFYFQHPSSIFNIPELKLRDPRTYLRTLLKRVVENTLAKWSSEFQGIPRNFFLGIPRNKGMNFNGKFGLGILRNF